MPSRISSGGLLLPPAAVRSEAPARAEIMRSLAGRAAELYELALGEACLGDNPPVTGPNPQGLTGWDLSGPPWGSALLHPVAWSSGRSPNTAVVIAPGHDDQTERKFGGSLGPAHVRFPFYLRPFDSLPEPSIAPYARLTLALRSYRISGATTPTATVRVWNAQAGQDREQAVSSTYTTTAADTSQTFSNTLKVTAVPGWNLLELELAVAPGDSSVHFLTSFLLYNVVKRTH
jgi:hypothetical protein